MLLLARSENIWCSFLNQPIEVTQLWNKVREVYDNMEVEIVKPTPRRQVEEVICLLAVYCHVVRHIMS
jgi:hypothetical protein